MIYNGYNAVLQYYLGFPSEKNADAPPGEGPGLSFIIWADSLLCSDLLDHEDGVREGKAYEADGDQGDNMGIDDDDALAQRKGVLKPGRGELFHGPHQNNRLILCRHSDNSYSFYS